jgi:hypothetical protein
MRTDVHTSSGLRERQKISLSFRNIRPSAITGMGMGQDT